MVLTDRQRSDLHAGIYEYLCSRKELIPVAETMRNRLPDLAERYSTQQQQQQQQDQQQQQQQQPNESTTQERTPITTASSLTTSTTTTTLSTTTNNNNTTPLLEKKWTAIPRLQKKVLELEKHIAQSAKIHAHRMGSGGGMMMMNGGTDPTSSTLSGANARMLPRLPPTHVLNGHSMVITCCTIHPMYTLAMSGSEDGTIKVWDHESGDYIRTLKGHTNTVNSIQCSPKQGTYLVSCSTDLSIKLWELSTYQCLRTLRGHDHTISAVCFIPQMSGSSSGSNSSDNDNNNSISRKTGTGVDSTLAMSQFVLSASRDMTVKCWDIESGFCDYTVSDHTDWVRCIAVRQCDGSVWASSGNDQIIYVYETSTKRKITELRGHDHVVESIAFITEEWSTTSSTIAARSKSNKHTETVRDYLVSGSRDRSVKLWNISDTSGGSGSSSSSSSSSSSCIGTYKAHENWVRSVVLHPSGLYIISSSDDKSIRIYDIKNNRCLRTLDHAHDHFITCLAMHPTLPILISGSVDQTIRCWLLQ